MRKMNYAQTVKTLDALRDLIREGRVVAINTKKGVTFIDTNFRAKYKGNELTRAEFEEYAEKELGVYMN